jgi:GNAT superfamily N-acetyltransferase
MNYYELLPEETEEALSFRNSIFTQVNPDHWDAMQCTGVVARAEQADFPTDESIEGTKFAGKIVGFIPLQFRQQVLRPGLTIPVVYENAVGVDERLRSKGIGGHMIDTAAEFIADRADALFVIRGGEDTIGYRFYRKSGHSDLCYQTSFVQPEGFAEHASDDASIDDSSTHVREVEKDEWLTNEPALLDIYKGKYGNFGGGRPREPGYWREIVASHVFRENSWRYFLAYDQQGIAGYVLVARGTWHQRESSHVYEIAGKYDGVVEMLIDAAARLTSRIVRIPNVSLSNPVRERLYRLGFTDGRSEPHIMTRIVSPERLFGRLCDDTEQLPSWWNRIRIECSTPHRSVVLQDGSDEVITINLEMKEHMLARMLCCRVDVDAANRLELIRYRGEEGHATTITAKNVIEVLKRICRPAPWVQWYSDYV